MPRDLAALAPDLARTLRAVYRVSRAAVTGPQRAAATRAADRWTMLAVSAGWTTSEIARAVDVRPSSITGRIRRQRLREPGMPSPTGVLGAHPAPPTDRAVSLAHRRRLVGASEVARLVGCQPASVTSWAEARNVPFQSTPGGAKRLYDKFDVLRAADRQPLQNHRLRRRTRGPGRV